MNKITRYLNTLYRGYDSIIRIKIITLFYLNLTLLFVSAATLVIRIAVRKQYYNPAFTILLTGVFITLVLILKAKPYHSINFFLIVMLTGVLAAFIKNIQLLNVRGSDQLGLIGLVEIYICFILVFLMFYKKMQHTILALIYFVSLLFVYNASIWQSTGHFNLNKYFDQCAGIIMMTIIGTFLINFLNKTLEEKDALVKEIHDRVKNNLAVISSLITMQELQTKNNESQKHLYTTRSRINSMAVVHELLYRSEFFTSINLMDCINNLILFYKNQQDPNFPQIVISNDINDIYLKIDKALPLCHIMNELLANSLKHAFENYDGSQIKISAYMKKNDIQLVYKDNGVGLSENIDINNANTLGFLLIRTLVLQINGKIKIKRNEGTRVEIRFKK